MQKESKNQPNVLIIEDDPGHQRILELYLTRAGCTCECCFDGKTGLQKAMSGEFQLIFIDIHIPELDGFSVATRLSEHGDQTPLIAVTALTIGSLRRNALKIGFKEFLQKPFSEKQIQNIVAQFTKPNNLIN
jgi:DNA-binding response OmpR family regulator